MESEGYRIMILEILTGMALLSFIILVFFLIRALIRVDSGMERMNIKVTHVVTDLSETLNQLNKLVGQCHLITKNIDHKITDLDPMFNTINKIGSFCDRKFNGVNVHDPILQNNNNHSHIENDPNDELSAHIVNYITLADTCLKIIKQFKKGR